MGVAIAPSRVLGAARDLIGPPSLLGTVDPEYIRAIVELTTLLVSGSSLCDILPESDERRFFVAVQVGA